jgi:excisionase family DNA binding protein
MMTVTDVAELLQVPERYVYRIVQERRITYSRIGKYLRFRRADVDAYLTAARREALRGPAPQRR